MRKTLALLASAALMGLTLAAHADSVVFDFQNASFGAGYDVVGNVTIDTTAGKITATNFSIGSQSFAGASVTAASATGFFATVIFTNYGQPNQAGFGFRLPTVDNTLVGYTGGVICSTANLCNANYSQYYPPHVQQLRLIDGSLVAEGLPAALPTAATPEPSSLVLLGTGILGLAGAGRRRFLKA